MDLLRACVLGAALLGLAGALGHEGVKEAMLQKLGLDRLPAVHKRDLENLVVPTHVRNKYLSMLKAHRSRRRRSAPSLAGILRGIPGNADISGEFLYSDSTRHRIVFDMETRIPNNSEVTMAELKLFQRASQSKRFAAERRSHRPVRNARVSVYWVNAETNRNSLVDSRLIAIRETGWKSFDVTQAVQYWAKTRKDTPMHLEVWIEGERPGSYAAEMAKSVRFTTQEAANSSDTSGKPELVLYTLDLEEYGSRGDCDHDKAACCREEHFIDFHALSWTQYWVVEPAGYQAYRCAGGCKQPRLDFGYGERRCAASESAPLPIMYLVKKGGHTEIEVAEFPNMVVERCECTLDNISVV